MYPTSAPLRRIGVSNAGTLPLRHTAYTETMRDWLRTSISTPAPTPAPTSTFARASAPVFAIFLSLFIPLFILLLLLAVLPSGAPAAPATGSSTEVIGVEGPRILVRLEAGAPEVEEAIDLDGVGLEWAGSIPGLQIEILSLRGKMRPERLDALLAALRGNPYVRTAEPDATRTIQRIPNDPKWDWQWGLAAAEFPGAWDVVTGDPGVVIAVLDTGVVRDVPDLQGRIVHPYSVEYETSDWPAWEDIVGHGTRVATVAAAEGDNGVGMAGAAWGVKVMPVHLSDADHFALSDELKGIMWALDHGADIINISAGSLESSALEQEVMQQVREAGILVVAAAGNGGEAGPVQYPAAYSEVLAVGATDFDDDRASFSSGGEGLGMMAPGGALVCYGANEVSYFLDRASGTSFAAPLVSGAAALLLSVDPTLSPQELTTILTSSAEDLGPAGWDEDYGWGQLDAAAAVASLNGGGAPSTTTTTAPSTTTTTTTVPPSTTTTAPSTTTTTIPRTFFTDVEPDHPYYVAIVASARAGVVSGYGDGRFGPDDALTRQQFTKMILRTLKAPVSEKDVCRFGDVGRSGTDQLYPDNYVAAAERWGITKGTSIDPPRFAPYDLITRAQAITMVVRGVDHLRVGRLEDPPVGYTASFGRFSPVHDSAAAKAEYNGLLDDLVGMESGSQMWDSVTRGEVAAVLAPLLDL